jgi:hypothetical protein
MDTAEARGILAAELDQLKRRSYAELRQMAESRAVETREVTGPSGAWYQLEIQAVWDDRPGGCVRVLASIDDGGWRAWVPLTNDFIIAPDGSFLGGL